MKDSGDSRLKILFVCSRNQWRSPTAEHIFAGHSGNDVSSAGTNNDAENPLTPELVEWADTIFVMERIHRSKLQKQFRSSLTNQRIICLDIPDDFEFMDPMLIRLLRTKMARYLPISAIDPD